MPNAYYFTIAKKRNKYANLQFSFCLFTTRTLTLIFKPKQKMKEEQEEEEEKEEEVVILFIAVISTCLFS